MDITAIVVKKINKNDRKTILSLYNYTFNKLMSVIVRYFVNEEDRITIVNNCFMKIINNINKFNIGTSYFSWVGRIANNEIIDNFRREKNYSNMFSKNEFNEDIEFIEEEEYDGDFTVNELLTMIDDLPKASKIVFNMYAIDGDYTYNDIAEILEVSTETVKWHLKTARKLLKQKIQDKQIEIIR